MVRFEDYLFLKVIVADGKNKTGFED